MVYQRRMTKVQFSLPDELARAADEAGLLAPEALQKLLREKLRADSIAALDKAWSHSRGGEISAKDDRLIAEAIQQVRAARKAA